MLFEFIDCRITKINVKNWNYVHNFVVFKMCLIRRINNLKNALKRFPITANSRTFLPAATSAIVSLTKPKKQPSIFCLFPCYFLSAFRFDKAQFPTKALKTSTVNFYGR